MAKQSGIHQLNGKVRGMSYYRQKGVNEGLARSINQGLSKRVKEGEEYANTRLNAAEFGSAGAFAGACVRAIRDRQRSMMMDFATGMLAKDIKKIIVLDTENPWGERQLVGIAWQNLVIDKLNTFAKLAFDSYVGGAFDTAVTDGDGAKIFTPNAELPAGWGELYKAKGATGAIVEMYAYLAAMSGDGEGAKLSESSSVLIGEADIALGEAGTITEPATVDAMFTGVQASNTLQGVLVIVKPYQEVNGVKYTRQELCTYKIVEPTVG